MSHVSEVVEAEAAKIFLWFDQYLRLRIVKQDDFPGDSPVEYLIAGYQGGVPTIYSVHLDVDWQQLHLKGVQRVLLHPELHNAENLRIYGVGSKRLLQQLAQRQGALYRRLLSSAPLESRMLIDQKEISLKQAGNLVRAVLEIEALANPDQVSPPFTIVTIPNDGSPQ